MLAVLGLGLIAYGVYGWLDAPADELRGRLVFAAVALAVHDFVLVPLVLLASVLVTRLLPAPARHPARAALVVAAALTAVALPFVVGAGRVAGNPSAFPQHYGRNLVLLLTVVAVAGGAWAAVRVARERGRR
ncbi:hypothetical protein GCM10010170_112430 [Dactylosporangium salmoneum]|uniref:Uncharacterized protein n=1 Tax=Dactylosporangium salmoneum TaxID=53361 RepID=A0ABN3I904_9ACTN